LRPLGISLTFVRVEPECGEPVRALFDDEGEPECPFDGLWPLSSSELSELIVSESHAATVLRFVLVEPSPLFDCFGLRRGLVTGGLGLGPFLSNTTCGYN
jgi:hypothetical protein